MPKANRRLPARVWYGPDLLRIAHAAGEGKSAREIAHMVGGTDAAKVRALLSKHGLPLIRRSGGEDALVLRWKRTDGVALEKAALARDCDPAYLAALIIRNALARGPEFLGDLVHEFDVI